jgi:hypothetical protein
MTASEQTTAAAEGPAWSAGASGWVEYWAGFAAPARQAAAPCVGTPSIIMSPDPRVRAPG